MKKINHGLSFCIFFLLGFFCTPFPGMDVFGVELKPQWQTSASYKITLSIRDKLKLNTTHKAKYVVKKNDLTFIAEREAIAATSNSAIVVFPDDFCIPESGAKAWLIFDGKEYQWEIYVDDVLMESGKFIFTRSKLNNSN